MYTDEQLKPYIEDLQKLELDESLIKYIQRNKNTENFDALVEHCCDVFLDEIQRMFYKYDKHFEEYKNNHPNETNLINLYIKTSELIDNDKLVYYHAVSNIQEFFVCSL